MRSTSVRVKKKKHKHTNIRAITDNVNTHIHTLQGSNRRRCNANPLEVRVCMSERCFGRLRGSDSQLQTQ